MIVSRRRLMQWAASMSIPGAPTPRRFVQASHSPTVRSAFRPELLPSKKEIWDLMHSQIQVFAKLIHAIDAMSASQLKKA